jgi:hypothetical protein
MKRQISGPQNPTQKTKDCVTQTQLNQGQYKRKCMLSLQYLQNLSEYCPVK